MGFIQSMDGKSNTLDINGKNITKSKYLFLLPSIDLTLSLDTKYSRTWIGESSRNQALELKFY